MPETGQIIPVKGPVHLVWGRGQGRFPSCHAILIEGRMRVLIDPGAGPRALEPLAREGVDLILLSHSHPDHTAGAHLFGSTPVLAPESGAQGCGRLQALCERFFHLPDIGRAYAPFVRERMDFVDRAPDGTYREGQQIGQGPARILPLATPGHTRDHHCFHLPELDMVITADIDLTPFGPWYGHLESDTAAFGQGIQRVMELAPRLLVPAHRPPETSDPQGALRAYLEHFRLRELAILEALRRPRSLTELTSLALIYGDHSGLPLLMPYWEGIMVGHHLAELERKGLIQQGDRGFIRSAPA